jgi:hypothetical protein
MSADFEQVMAQCSRGCFTGLLRVRTREGNGEVRFLSGIQDGIRFDSMEGDAALERLIAASDPEFEAISSLPPIDFNSTEPVPPEGALNRFHAAQLMRYCETNSLTCALELEVEGRILKASYRLGELLSVEPDSEHTSRLAEAKEGLYRFRLPRFELPPNVQQRRSVPAVAPKAAPAPVAVTKPAAAPAPAPSPFKAPSPVRSTPASLAETPLMAMKPVAIVSPTASPAPAKAPARSPAPASPFSAATSSVPPAAPKVAAAGAARSAVETRPAPSRSAGAPAATVGSAASPSARGAEPRLGPSAVTPQPTRVAAQAPASIPPRSARASGSPPTASPPAASPPAAAHPPASRSPVPSAPPPSPPATQGKAAPLQGLWTDAVKPPPQSAPLELDSAMRSAAAGGAQKPIGRNEGLSSIAYSPTDVPAPVPPSRRTPSSARYWLVAVALLFVVAVLGWFIFGR